MADPPPYPDADPDASMGPDRGSTTGTPRWVKVFGIVALVVVLLVVIVLFVQGSGGGHGPGRHTPSDDAGGPSPSSVTENHTPPVGSHG